MESKKEMKKEKKMKNELTINDPYAEITEVKDMENNNDNGITVFCSKNPNDFTFQIQTFKPTNWPQEGKKRNMFAQVTLTVEKMEEILKFVRAYAKEDHSLSKED